MRTAIAFAMLVLALLVTAGPAGAARRTLVVDNDHVQCSNAQYTSITAAVSAAAAGDRIRVCAGLYNESVAVNKPRLSLEGSTALGTGACLGDGNASDPTRDTVVHGRVSLLAARDELRGFTVELAPTGDTGVYTSPTSSGYVISHNVIQQNEGGINLNANGVSETFVSGNCIRSNNENDPVGKSDDAIFSEQGLLHRATIESNTFTGHLQGSMLLGYGLFGFPTVTVPSTDITVTRNRMVDDGDFAVFLNNVRDVQVSRNQILRLGEGVDVFPPAGDVLVDRNDIRDAAFYSIRVDGDPFGCCTYPGGPTDVVVARNSILRSGSIGPRDGILLFDTSGQVVVDNEIRDSYRDGISLRQGSSGNLIAGNHVTGSGRDGIRNRDTSSGNTYYRNNLFGNVEHDAHDDNWPTNTWRRNHCVTDFPAGMICS